MRSTIRTAALSLTLTLAVAAPAAWAQADPGGPRQASSQFQAMREARERQRAQDLRIILRLRPDQEPALTAFLQSQTRPMGGAPEHRAPPTEAMTTPQRLDEMARRDAERAQARQARTATVRAFYASLAPDQRQVFDALMRMKSGGRGREGGRFGGRGFDGPRRGPPGGPPWG
jgi:hypothetical protein